MKSKMYEYHNKDIPFLRKDVFIRFVFALVFVLLFVWQIVVIFTGSEKPNILEMVLGTLTLITCLFFAAMSFIYGYQSLTSILEIKKNGKAVKNIVVMPNVSKKSFAAMYAVFLKIFAFIMLLIFVSGVTYTILELTYYSTVSFFIPLLIVFTISGFNSYYHVKTSIRVVNEVQEYNPFF